eukprot:14127790-Heterocapsa_arctica.AAC.1
MVASRAGRQGRPRIRPALGLRAERRGGSPHPGLRRACYAPSGHRRHAGDHRCQRHHPLPGLLGQVAPHRALAGAAR